MSFSGGSAVLRPAGRPVRLLRSSAAALVCTVTAAFGHLVGGGELAESSVLMIFGGAAAIAWLLSARRVTAGQTVGLLVLCQIAMHGASMSTSAEMSMTAPMLLAHVAATALSAAALARGEAFVWALADRLGLRAVAIGSVHAVPHLSPAPVTHDVTARRDVHLTYARIERGPPNASS